MSLSFSSGLTHTYLHIVHLWLSPWRAKSIFLRTHSLRKHSWGRTLHNIQITGLKGDAWTTITKQTCVSHQMNVFHKSFRFNWNWIPLIVHNWTKKRWNTSLNEHCKAHHKQRSQKNWKYHKAFRNCKSSTQKSQIYIVWNTHPVPHFMHPAAMFPCLQSKSIGLTSRVCRWFG